MTTTQAAELFAIGFQTGLICFWWGRSYQVLRDHTGQLKDHGTLLDSQGKLLERVATQVELLDRRLSRVDGVAAA